MVDHIIVGNSDSPPSDLDETCRRKESWWISRFAEDLEEVLILTVGRIISSKSPIGSDNLVRACLVNDTVRRSAAADTNANAASFSLANEARPIFDCHDTLGCYSGAKHQSKHDSTNEEAQWVRTAAPSRCT